MLRASVQSDHRQAVGDVLREVRSAHLEVDRVFALRQGRQRYPEPISQCPVCTRRFPENVVLRQLHLEKVRLSANYSMDFLTVDRNDHAELGVGQQSSHGTLDFFARLLIGVRFWVGEDPYSIHDREEKLATSRHGAGTHYR